MFERRDIAQHHMLPKMGIADISISSSSNSITRIEWHSRYVQRQEFKFRNLLQILCLVADFYHLATTSTYRNV